MSSSSSNRRNMHAGLAWPAHSCGGQQLTGRWRLQQLLHCYAFKVCGLVKAEGVRLQYLQSTATPASASSALARNAMAAC